jgi:hypothetical protein
MFNYLYYKLYRASLKSSLKDVPHILALKWRKNLPSSFNQKKVMLAQVW